VGSPAAASSFCAGSGPPRGELRRCGAFASGIRLALSRSVADLDPQDSPHRANPGKGSRTALVYGGEPPHEDEDGCAGDGETVAYGTLDGEAPVPVGFREDVESLLGIDLDAIRRGDAGVQRYGPVAGCPQSASRSSR
jgi:hypothetical protein